MGRRPACEGLHDWVNRDSKWTCTKCPERFPCAYDCGHVDCLEARGKPPKCLTCHKPVPQEETYVVTQGLRTYVMHLTCRKGAETE